MLHSKLCFISFAFLHLSVLHPRIRTPRSTQILLWDGSASFSSLLSIIFREFPSFLLHVIGCIPRVRDAGVAPPWTAFPFQIFQDIPSFRGKTRRCDTVTNMSSEDDLTSRHASFNRVQTGSSVHMITGKVS